MRKMHLGKSGVEVPVIAVGCMRMADKTVDEAKEVIDTALNAGLNFFDHADLYGGGKSEEVFGKALSLPPFLCYTEANQKKGDPHGI